VAGIEYSSNLWQEPAARLFYSGQRGVICIGGRAVVLAKANPFQKKQSGRSHNTDQQQRKNRNQQSGAAFTTGIVELAFVRHRSVYFCPSQLTGSRDAPAVQLHQFRQIRLHVRLAGHHDQVDVTSRILFGTPSLPAAGMAAGLWKCHTCI